MANHQLATVRKMVRNAGTSSGKLIAVASGKGGVGKTNVALNLSIALVKLGKRVLLVDADCNLANVDLLLGITPTYTFKDILFGTKEVAEVVFRHELGMDVLPGSAGLGELIAGKGNMSRMLIDHLQPVRKKNDCLILDTAAGLTAEVVDFLICSDEVLMITTPEPTAIADAYALIKVIHRARPSIPIKVAFNFVESEAEADEVAERFSLVVDHFLKRPVEYVGYIIADFCVPRAVKQQQPFIVAFPDAESSRNITSIAQTLMMNTESSLTGDLLCDI